MSDGIDYDDDEAIVQEFLIESYENLDALDRQFVDLEREPEDTEIISSIFRTIHTIKGTSGFLGFSNLEIVTHRGENLLSQLRDGEKRINPEITSALLSMVDAVRDILAVIEETGKEGDGEYSALIANLERLTAMSAEEMAAAEMADEPTAAAAAPAATEAAPEAALPTEAKAEEPIQAVAADESPATPTLGESPVVADEPPPAPATEAQQDVPAADTPPTPAASPTPPTEAAAKPEEKAAKPKSARAGSVADSSIRVDVKLLDKLMNQVGELVLARNQVIQYSAGHSNAAFLATCQRLNQITTELQEGVMKTRMQPIENVWSKFPRVVRDLANGCDKQVTVKMEGKETELDKTILESIKDPLTHVVRNSVDHGIETPEERVAAGKPAEGTLSLRAFHEGGQVNIEIADDGKGIDPEKLKAKAIEKEVVTPERAENMTDREIVNLIFSAGFSTAEKVTNVSGRGVGMDVVRSNVEKIGGTVDVQSRLGQGTTLKIKIPLTLAIIPALIVGNQEDRFAIPQVSLLELVRLEDDLSARGIEMIQGAPFYRLRGKLLPIIYLREELGENSTSENDSDEATNTGTNIVVLQADDHQFGLVVDEVNDTEEIVVKPLGDQLKGLSAFAGATIMGDGSVALILDVLGLAQRAQIVSEHAKGEDSLIADRQESDLSDGAARSLLVLGLGEDRKMAVDLSLVARLEEFDREAIESAGAKEAVQYRDQIMPLVMLPRYFGLDSGEKTSEGRDTVHVIVYKSGEQSIGLVVDEILDVVEERVEIQQCSKMNGVLGTAIVQGELTDLVDIESIVLSELGITSAQPSA
ncbi:MAG: chemotaxis protein CheA [Myxococcota bacterium]